MDKLELINEYKARINRTLDYIELHYDRQFTLEELSLIANFSKFHFNRIFLSLIGETPFQFINRIRLEKAATLLVIQRNLSIKEIAFKCGFSDIISFLKEF